MNDLISRQEAIDAVDVKCLHRGIVKGLQAIIEDLPSAQPERKKGAWIVIDDAERKYQCDECKAMSYVLGNFFPNCGADMRGESDEKQHSQEVD